MKKMVACTIIHCSTWCSRSPACTQWWRSPTGTGTQALCYSSALSETGSMPFTRIWHHWWAARRRTSRLWTRTLRRCGWRQPRVGWRCSSTAGRSSRRSFSPTAISNKALAPSHLTRHLTQENHQPAHCITSLLRFQEKRFSVILYTIITVYCITVTLYTILCNIVLYKCIVYCILLYSEYLYSEYLYLYSEYLLYSWSYSLCHPHKSALNSLLYSHRFLSSPSPTFLYTILYSYIYCLYCSLLLVIFMFIILLTACTTVVQ